VWSPKALPALPGRARAPGRVAVKVASSWQQTVLPGADFAPPPARCPGRPLRADSGLGGQVKPVAEHQKHLWARSGAGGVPVSLLISKLFRGRRRSPERKLGCCSFCQRFTRRLDVVLGVNVVVDVSSLVSRKPLEEDSFLWWRPLARNWHPNRLPTQTLGMARPRMGIANPLGRAGVPGRGPSGVPGFPPTAKPARAYRGGQE